MTLRKIAAGHYAGPRGTVQNIRSASGAPHTRGRATWLVTYTDGRTALVRALGIARLLLEAPAPIEAR